MGKRQNAGNSRRYPALPSIAGRGVALGAMADVWTAHFTESGQRLTCACGSMLEAARLLAGGSGTGARRSWDAIVCPDGERIQGAELLELVIGTMCADAPETRPGLGSRARRRDLSRRGGRPGARTYLPWMGLPGA